MTNDDKSRPPMGSEPEEKIGVRDGVSAERCEECGKPLSECPKYLRETTGLVTPPFVSSHLHMVANQMRELFEKNGTPGDRDEFELVLTTILSLAEMDDRLARVESALISDISREERAAFGGRIETLAGFVLELIAMLEAKPGAHNQVRVAEIASSVAR